MGKVRAVRLLTAIALVVPASGAAWAVSGPASAATKPKPSCSVLIGNATKPKTSKLSGCTPATATGGNAASVNTTGAGTTGTATLTWAGKHGKTVVSYSYKIVTPSKCGTSVVKGKKTSNTEVVETGTVSSSTGLVAKSVKAGDATSATVCINAATSAESLLKGTKFIL
jgi:hypothetical protein